jgi:large conductance mechanosensitive channel
MDALPPRGHDGAHPPVPGRVPAGAQTAKERGMAFFREYREFISRGNVVDLAVGIVIGAAFTGIVNSLVDDILMPVIGIFTGGIDLTKLAFRVGAAEVTYGNFLQALVNFLVIGFAIFLLVRVINRIHRREPPAPPAPPEEVVLLKEIRDTLKAQLATQTPAPITDAEVPNRVLPAV